MELKWGSFLLTSLYHVPAPDARDFLRFARVIRAGDGTVDAVVDLLYVTLRAGV
jgi:hypothetical protein